MVPLILGDPHIGDYILWEYTGTVGHSSYATLKKPKEDWEVLFFGFRGLGFRV